MVVKNIIFIAPPAAGKGTQSKLLSEKYGMVHISTGDLLRHEIALETEIGIRIKELIENGHFASDEVMIELLESRIKQDDCNNGYILDGFPRDIEQAIAYDEMSKRLNRLVDYVIFLNITKEEAMKRITGRISCPSCGEVYNEYFDTFKDAGLCNKCSTKLVKRNDDNIKAFNIRFDTYISKTKPVIDYYKNKGILYVVDSSGAKEQTFAQIDNIVGGRVR